MMRVARRKTQQGVAVITALLLTTLAITIVASLFWQQQVQVRSIENQRMQLQKQWILRGAIDWARLILREDARLTRNVDHLGEPWAVRLADTQLDQYVENGKAEGDEANATLSGQIVDAQSLYNLTNLATDGVPDPREVAVFSRLLSNLRMPPELAESTAATIAKSQAKVKTVASSSPGTATVSSGSVTSVTDAAASQSDANSANSATEISADTVQFLRFIQTDDLLAVNGFTPEMLLRLKNFVTVLPRKTEINVNTASPEVLSARIDGVSMGDAAMMIASRERAYFLSLTDFKHRFQDKTTTVADKDLSVATHFFIVNGKVKMQRSALDVSALLERSDDASTSVLWIREN